MAPKKKPTDELKDQRVPIMMSEDELKAIDDWSFANRIRSRGEAIRRLCQIGLEFDAKSDRIFSEIVKATQRLSKTSKELSESTSSGAARTITAGFEASIAGLDSISEIMALYGPLYLQALPGRASGDVKEVIEIISEFREHFDSLKGDRKELLAAVAETLSIITEARRVTADESEVD